jgi:hypothetical protein
LIDAPRQSELAKPAARDNHSTTRPPLLILIDAPFSSRLSRYRQGDLTLEICLLLRHQPPDAHPQGVRKPPNCADHGSY